MNISRMIVIGMTKLNYTETEVFAMTPRKYFLLFNALAETVPGHGVDDYAIDAMWAAL